MSIPAKGYKFSLQIIPLIISLLGLDQQLFAQGRNSSRPSGLMCDLVGAANYQSINGYAINPTPANLTNNNVRSVRIVSERPAFSWVDNDAGTNVLQVAYQILVADSRSLIDQNMGNIWNSGKVISGQSAAVQFMRGKLKSNATYYWKVRTWSNKQQVSPYSFASTFYTGNVSSLYQTPTYPLQISEAQGIRLTKYGGTYFIDYRRDAFGQLKINLFSKTGNDTVTIRIGEVLNANGNIDRHPSGSVRYAQYLLPLQKGSNTYRIKIDKNKFNTRPGAIKMPDYIGEVTPFRYCEVDGYNEPLQIKDVKRLSVHYPFDDTASDFNCADSTLNAVWSLCRYSVKATSYLGLYVDGDRERTPYEADAYINQLSHYAVDKEFTLARNSHEYLINHPTWPTEWILQSVLIAWNDYLYTGDIASARRYYSDLKKKTLVALADSSALISTLNGKMTSTFLDDIHHGSSPLKDIVDWPHGTETDGFVFSRYNSVVNAFYYRALVIMEKIAHDLGESSDAELFQLKASRVKNAYKKFFFDPDRGVYVDGDTTKHASLHANAFALALGLVDKEDERTVVNFIKSRGMACSVYGSQFLLDGLYDAGEGAYSLSLLTSKSDRSWFNMLRVGSTITLEAWDNKYKPNQDWNHAWGSAPANIIVRKLMGIAPLTPGWSRFCIKPQISDLGYAHLKITTIKGVIETNCKQTAQAFELEAAIPVNTLAEVYLPFKPSKTIKIKFDNKIITPEITGQSVYIPNVGSGKHLIKVIY